MIIRHLTRALCAASLSVAGGMSLHAQEMVKFGELEAQTGAINTYGWMSSQGTRLAVEEINKAGGFEVAGKKYKFDFTQVDTRGEPREATVQFRKMMEDKVPFVFGPFLSNIFNAIRPIAEQNDGKFLLMGGATSEHDYLGKAGSSYLIRTWNWDAGPEGFGTLMVQYIKKLGAKKVAMLFQNDAFGKVAVDIYKKIFADAGIELSVDMFEPGTKDFTSSLAKIAATKPDFLFPGYTDAILYDIVRQSLEGGYGAKFFIVRGSIGPALKNKDQIEDYIAYVPKYFEEAEKTEPAVKKFIEAYKAFYKRDFPYDQAPLCSSSCYDHVYMLVEAMKKAGTVTEVAKIREALSGMRYSGLWNIKYDSTGEEVISFNIAHVKKGGSVEVQSVDPTAK
ncbi:MAG: ABC transporter substrate-binding protein [Methylobacteriaceae bacterium]|nr:ABC transporter substrate-binding protein [Methylobacteriaceae bacterium]